MRSSMRVLVRVARAACSRNGLAGCAAAILLLLVVLAPLRRRDDLFAPADSWTDSTDAERYFLVVDAGSSGSRLFVYVHRPGLVGPAAFVMASDASGAPATRKTKPGLSHYAEREDYSGGVRSVEELLRWAAREVVPEALHATTPVSVLATAGMRMVGAARRAALFDALAAGIDADSPFRLGFGNAVRMIDGKEEAAFAWYATNFVEGTLVAGSARSGSAGKLEIGTGAAAVDRRPTIGAVDLGGGSMQITFELAPGEFADDAQSVEIAGRRLYAASFLGFGANAVRERDVQARLAPRATAARLLSAEGGEPTVEDPCLPSGLRERWRSGAQTRPASQPTAADDALGGRATLVAAAFDPPFRLPTSADAALGPDADSFVVEGSGDWAACVAAVRPMLGMSADCARAPTCSVDGVYLPAVAGGASPRVAPRAAWYAFSEYWYTTNDVWGFGQSPYDAERVESAATRWCSRRSWAEMRAEWSERPSLAGPRAVDGDRLRRQCFKAAWMALTLEGYGFGPALPSLAELGRSGPSGAFREGGGAGRTGSAWRSGVSIVPHDPDGVSWTLGAALAAHPAVALAALQTGAPPSSPLPGLLLVALAAAALMLCAGTRGGRRREREKPRAMEVLAAMRVKAGLP